MYGQARFCPRCSSCKGQNVMMVRKGLLSAFSNRVHVWHLRNGNEELCVASIHARRSEAPAVFGGKLVWVTGRSCVAHVGEFVGPGTLCPLGLDRVLDSGWYRVVNDPVASSQLDLLGQPSLGRLLSFSPGHLTSAVIRAELRGKRGTMTVWGLRHGERARWRKAVKSFKEGRVRSMSVVGRADR